nr:increased DNA methylation 1 [Ipomoea batatas]
MAADSEERNRRGKRKRDQTRPKLLSGEKVEVRSLEEGFLGSWHSGEVVRCEKSFRHVQYDHILCDDESASLIEFVGVSPLIDGVKSAQREPNNSRGVIRPLPPSLGFTKSSLRYGQCVDSFIEDAWWEGVIFDHEDGSEERKIFFPDQGDDMMVCVGNLRITQDWDELTEEWKPRGNWLFLEVIDEVKQEWPLFVSVKQIWYEVREKNGKNDLKEWTFSVTDYWRKLASQVILDNLKFSVDQFLGLLNSSERFVQEGPLLEFSESVLNAVLKPETYINGLLALAPFTKSSSQVEDGGVLPNNLNVSCHHIVENEVVPEGLVRSIGDVEVGFSSKNVDTQLIPSHDETQSLPLHMLPCSSHSEIGATGSLLDDYGETIPYTNSKVPSEKLKSSRRRSNVEWLPLDLEAEFCPDAIIQFQRKFMLGRKNLHVKVRKHLLYLGWKIECDCEMTRLRYFSPSGKLYMSLSKLCNEFDTTSESLSMIPMTRRQDVSPDRSLDITSGSSADGFTSCPPLVRQQECRKKSVLRSLEVTIDPKYCPQAVSDYVLCQKENTLHSKKGITRLAYEAKKHLVFSGWKVFNYLGRGKKQFCYVSPSRRVFYSLLTACKWYFEESASCPDTPGNLATGTSPGMSPSKEKETSKSRTKRKLSFHESRGLFDEGNVADTKSSPRVLRSSKRARQVSSSHRTPRTILSWLIDNNVVLPETTVQYCGRKDGPPLKEGKITRDGIKCNCCQNVYSLSNFEIHAGSTNHRPSANIFLEDGRSLLKCQLEMKHKSSVKNSKTEPRMVQGSHNLNRNDHICSICQDGGDLILCDRCPSSFHTSCLGMKVIPDGDWFCPSCCCGICGQSGFDKSNDQFTDNSILCCYQCGHQYHYRCVGDESSEPENCPKGNWFCNTRCERIFLGLHQLLGKPIPVGTDMLTWTLLKNTNPNDSYYGAPDDESMTENYGKLSVALSVMHECFEPVKESRTRRDLMEDIIFSRWSELNRLNFQGFYTVVLEKNDELITVATVRVHDDKVAEIPLVATRFQYRRHGMCRILMNELEKQLVALGVERLVLPAVSSALDTWTTSFGFKEMKGSERLDFLKYTFLDFHGTIMCQKLLTDVPSIKSSVSAEEADEQSFDHNNNGNADLDGNITISEVFQAEQLNGSETVDQASLEPSGGGSGANDDSAPAPLVLAVQFLFLEPHILIPLTATISRLHN